MKNTLKKIKKKQKKNFCWGGSAPPDPPILQTFAGGASPPQTPPFSARIGRIGRSVGSVRPVYIKRYKKVIDPYIKIV